MSLIISTGSNLKDRVFFIHKAKELLCEQFKLIEESNIYESPAVDYLNQPDFLNQVLHFELPTISPSETLTIINNIEADCGRERFIDKGPRTLDIDILFWSTQTINEPNLTIPHPRQFQRSFIICPLMELKVFDSLKTQFKFSDKFDNKCWVFKSENV